jgi:hypothetical protein
LVIQHRPNAEGLISILKCLKAKSYVLSLPARVLVTRPSALRKRLMHFPFEIIIWDAHGGIIEKVHIIPVNDVV